MTSPNKIQANRRNAQKSTGPRTPQGKARSAQNALTHGLRAERVLLPGEDPELFRRFSDDLLRELNPATPRQHYIATKLITYYWKLDRLAGAESHLYQRLHENYLEPPMREYLQEFGHDPAAGREPLTPQQLLAYEFSINHSNAFLRLEGYERSLLSSILRLSSELRRLQRQSPPDLPEASSPSADTAPATNEPTELPIPSPPVPLPTPVPSKANAPTPAASQPASPRPNEPTETSPPPAAPDDVEPTRTIKFSGNKLHFIERREHVPDWIEKTVADFLNTRTPNPNCEPKTANRKSQIANPPP